MKVGDKVKLIDTKKLSDCPFRRQLKKGNAYTIQRVKSTGGLILEEVRHTVNIFGNEQGIRQENFIVVKKRGKKK